MPIIEVDTVTKEFRTPKRQTGILGGATHAVHA